eukprot:g1778.t1
MWDGPPPPPHAPPLPTLGGLAPTPFVPPPPTFGTPVAFPQIQSHPAHPALHHAPHAPPPIPGLLAPPPPPGPPPAMLGQPPGPPPVVPPPPIVSLGDAEVKAAASAALSKFIKNLPDEQSASKGKSRSRSQSRRSRSRSLSAGVSAGYRAGRRFGSSRKRRRKRSGSRKRSSSRRRRRSKEGKDAKDSLLEPPPAPRSKWDDSTTPAWMQDMVEALKSSEPAPTASAKKNDPDKPKGHKVIDLPAHLIRVLIGKAGSTIREVISRTSGGEVNHLPHEPQGSISVVGDIAKTEAVIQEIFRARGCKWSPTGAPLAEQSEETTQGLGVVRRAGLVCGDVGEVLK